MENCDIEREDVGYESEAEELDLKSKTVEEQLQYLSHKVIDLSKKLKTQREYTNSMKSILYKTYEVLKKAKEERETLRTNNIGDLPNSRECQQSLELSISKAQKEASQSKRLLLEQQQSNIELREKYEEHLAILRHATQSHPEDIRRDLLMQVDGLIRRYRGLARRAVEVANDEKKVMQEERKKVQQLAESACKQFENRIKEKTKKALLEYKDLAEKAHKAAEKERISLKSKCEHIEMVAENDRRKFETTLLEETEKHLKELHRSNVNLRDQLNLKDSAFNQLLDEISQQVKLECNRFEEQWINRIMVLLESNGLKYTKEEIRNLLVPEVYEKTNQAKETVVSYGFTALGAKS